MKTTLRATNNSTGGGVEVACTLPADSRSGTKTEIFSSPLFGWDVVQRSLFLRQYTPEELERCANATWCS